MTSGGIGKKALSIKASKARIGFAYLAYKFGEKIGPFLDKQGTKWSIIIALIIILIITGIYFLFLK